MTEDRFKEEVIRYLSAIAVDVGDIRQRVTRLEERADVIEQEMKEGFDAVRKDIRILDKKLEIMTQDLMNARAEVRDHETRIQTLESKPV
jgi:chromosome segregation ATPase